MATATSFAADDLMWEYTSRQAEDVGGLAQRIAMPLAIAGYVQFLDILWLALMLIIFAIRSALGLDGRQTGLTRAGDLQRGQAFFILEQLERFQKPRRFSNGDSKQV